MTSNYVVSTSMRRHDVASTLIRRCFKAVRLLGWHVKQHEQINILFCLAQLNYAKVKLRSVRVLCVARLWVSCDTCSGVRSFFFCDSVVVYSCQSLLENSRAQMIR